MGGGRLCVERHTLIDGNMASNTRRAPTDLSTPTEARHPPATTHPCEPRYVHYRHVSLMRPPPPPAYDGSKGGGRFVMSEVPLLTSV